VGRSWSLPSGSHWAWAVLGAAVLVPVVPLLLVEDQERMKDLLVYVGAGATAGAGFDVYDFRTPFDMPFTYPPFAAVLSEPLSRVPLGVLHVLWVLASLAAVVGVARTALAPVVARLGLPLTVALCLLSSPVRSHLRFGQVGLFLALLVAADLLHDRRREGVGLGVAIAAKLTPAVLLPWLLLQRTRAALTSMAVAAGATAAGLLVLWPSAHEYLWRALWDSSRFGPNDIPGNQSVRGMLLRSGLDEQTATLCWLAAAVLLAVIGTLGARRLDRRGDRLGALGVLAALSVAVSPISWVHHLVFLALPLGALVASGRHRMAAAWAVGLTVSFPTLGTAGLRAGGPEVFWHLVIDLQGLTAVAAVILLPRVLSSVGLQRRRSAREPSQVSA
jgi:alpha-1,2-mannosyltransferase